MATRIHVLIDCNDGAVLNMYATASSEIDIKGLVDAAYDKHVSGKASEAAQDGGWTKMNAYLEKKGITVLGWLKDYTVTLI